MVAKSLELPPSPLAIEIPGCGVLKRRFNAGSSAPNGCCFTSQNSDTIGGRPLRGWISVVALRDCNVASWRAKHGGAVQAVVEFHVFSVKFLQKAYKGRGEPHEASSRIFDAPKLA